jgi:hypothetical protein
MVARDVEYGLATLAILQGTPAELATGGVAGAPRVKVGGHAPGRLDTQGPPFAIAPQASPPRGLDSPIFLRRGGGTTDDPALAEAVNPQNPWAGFVDAAAERYRPGGELARARGWPADAGVRAWEIGNEPNLAFFWSGTPAQFVRYLEVAYLVLKRRDPAAVVLHGGIADDSSASTWYNRFLDALKSRAAASPLPARNNHYFDKAAWHWYTYPALLQTGPDKARSLLSGKGLPAKPIWVTEMGVPQWNEHPGPCWDPISPWRATTVEQAGYAWQALAEGVAAGVETQVWFQLYDDCGNGPASYDAFGLVRNHASNQCWSPPQGQACWRFDPARAGQPRPAFAALQVAARELAAAQLLWRPPREADGWQRILFYQPPDKRVMVLWNHNRTARTVELFATGTEATQLTLADDGGVVTTLVRPDGGKLRPLLPGATNRNNPGNQSPVMAGRPVLLVERDVYAPFRALVKPLPEESGTTVNLSVSAADGGTGVGAFRVFVASAPPSSPSAWQPLVTERGWTASPLSGEMSATVTLSPGQSYWFAAQARDRAGNWSALPAAAQATTRVAGSAPSATTRPPASPTATRMPTATARTPATPWPTATAGTPPQLTVRRYLPLSFGLRTTPTGQPYPGPASP